MSFHQPSPLAVGPPCDALTAKLHVRVALVCGALIAACAALYFNHDHCTASTQSGSEVGLRVCLLVRSLVLLWFPCG